ncbi:Uncharacterised protein [Moraxella caprae]|uniref:Uncharacterized protein n=1 Tax=Moraxella caprae TaxID=90240 RepID=A0A378QY91_9GAMM|nr:Uncharacterised protein [Moraxella caprae]
MLSFNAFTAINIIKQLTFLSKCFIKAIRTDIFSTQTQDGQFNWQT